MTSAVAKVPRGQTSGGPVCLGHGTSELKEKSPGPDASFARATSDRMPERPESQVSLTSIIMILIIIRLSIRIRSRIRR